MTTGSAPLLRITARALREVLQAGLWKIVMVASLMSFEVLLAWLRTNPCCR